MSRSSRQERCCAFVTFPSNYYQRIGDFYTTHVRIHTFLILVSDGRILIQRDNGITQSHIEIEGHIEVENYLQSGHVEINLFYKLGITCIKFSRLRLPKSQGYEHCTKNDVKAQEHLLS